jgi:hypothetical protein
MSASYAPILHQRMSGLPVSLLGPPFLGVFQKLESYTEGNSVAFEIRRSGNSRGICSFTYSFSSTGGSGDFAGAVTDGDTFASGELTRTVSIATVDRSGIQGTRTITCTLTSVTDAVILPSNPFNTCELVDKPASGTPWHKLLPYRSGRPWAAGPSYFNRLGKDWRWYEENCGYADAFGGPNFGGNGSDKGRINTMTRVFGGPKGNPDSISNDGQLNFNTSNDFCKPFQEVPLGVMWQIFVCDLHSTNLSTDVGFGNSLPSTGIYYDLWQAFIDGTYDQELKDFGGRLVNNYEARGEDIQWLLLRPYHEMQQTNHYRIYPSTKLLYKSAMERMIDKIREGAGTHIRIMHCPSKDRTYDRRDFGSLESWCPTNIDAISISFHPNGEANTKAGLDEFFNGSASIYGIEGDVAELCARKGYKIAFGEWSPVPKSNTQADEVHRRFYEEFLIPHRDDIVCDTVYHAHTFFEDAADSFGPPQTEAGKQNWRDGVAKFKELWKGKSATQPNYTNPNWPTT